MMSVSYFFRFNDCEIQTPESEKCELVEVVCGTCGTKTRSVNFSRLKSRCDETLPKSSNNRRTVYFQKSTLSGVKGASIVN